MGKKASRYKKRAAKKKQKAEQNKQRRQQYRKRQRNKKIINYTILAAIVFAVGYGIFLAAAPDGPGEYDDFARCLADEGVTMYGTDWCQYCQAQKQSFGNSFRYVHYVNCDLNPTACDLAGVEGYPTWVFPEGPAASGVQDLDELAARTGCEL